MKKAYVDTLQGQVHYVTAGEGKPLMLLHETPRSWISYARMIPHLSAFRVIAMDTLGFGNSNKAPNDYDISDYAANVVSFLDVLGIARTHVVGDHTGAAIGVETAIIAPDRVDRLVLSGLPFYLNEDERVARRQQIMARDLDSRAADGSHCSRIWQYLLNTRIPGGGKTVLGADDIDLLAEISLDALNAGVAWKQMEIAMVDYDPRPRLPLVRSPTLAIGVTGEGTSIYTKRPREVAALLPQCVVRAMETDGRVLYTHAKELSEIISAFLQEADA
jgi:pimeloyl-ACP methyl ester carboxylesterase